MDEFRSQSAAHIKEGHEESDLSVRGIIVSGIVLVVAGIFSFIVVLAFYNGLKWWEKKNDAKLTPMEQQLVNDRGAPPQPEYGGALGKNKEGVKPPADWAEREKDEQRLQHTFPTPRLQYDDVHDLNLFRNSENEWLNSSGKTANGTSRIPIQRAMDLLVQRGLPSVSGPFLPANASATATEPSRESSHQGKAGRGLVR